MRPGRTNSSPRPRFTTTRREYGRCRFLRQPDLHFRARIDNTPLERRHDRGTRIDDLERSIPDWWVAERRRLRINVDHANGRDDVEWMVVGVVGNTKSSLDGPFRQTIFIPRTQRPGDGITVFVRARQDPMLLATSVTAIEHSMEAEAPVDVRTLEDVIGGTIARPRAISVLLGAFALAASASTVRWRTRCGSERRKSASAWRSARQRRPSSAS